MIDNVKLIVYDDFEQLINKDTGEVLASGYRLRAEDVLFALGCRFDIELRED